MRSWPALMLLLPACASWYVPVEPAGAKKPSNREGVASGEQIRVQRVLSGDSIELEDGRRVRYLGVRAPGPGEPWFAEATQANRELVEGKRVVLRFDGEPGRDTDGSWLAIVQIPASQFPQTPDSRDFVLAAYGLVASGAARVAPAPERFQNKGMLLQAEQQARAEGRGIWQAPGR